MIQPRSFSHRSVSVTPRTVGATRRGLAVCAKACTLQPMRGQSGLHRSGRRVPQRPAHEPNWPVILLAGFSAASRAAADCCSPQPAVAPDPSPPWPHRVRAAARRPGLTRPRSRPFSLLVPASGGWPGGVLPNPFVLRAQPLAAAPAHATRRRAGAHKPIASEQLRSV
ncbi:hypothetical protein D9M68_826060 [compost metagenome]